MPKKLPFYQPQETELVIDSQDLPASPLPLHFDYSVFDATTAQAMQTHARKIKAKGNKISNELIDIGGELAAAKEQVEHGQWLNWLRDELQLNDTAAQRMIAVYREFKEQRQIASLFHPRVLELMAGRKTPPAARQELIDQTQATGQSPTARAAAATIRRHKQPNPATLQHLGTTKFAPPEAEQAIHSADPDSALQDSPQPLLIFQSAPAPAWAIQNAVLAWLADYERTDHRPPLQIIQDLHSRKPPAWGSFEQHLIAHQITYRDPELTRALNDTMVTLRQQADPSQTVQPRHINFTEATTLILATLRAAVGPANETNPAMLLNALRAATVTTDYIEALPPNLILSNHIFQQAWHHVSVQLQSTLPSENIPAPPLIPTVAITLHLTPARLHTLIQHLKHGSLGRLPLDIIAELYEQIRTQS